MLIVPDAEKARCAGLPCYDKFLVTRMNILPQKRRQTSSISTFNVKPVVQVGGMGEEVK